MKKRVLSFLLLLAMLVTMVPAVAIVGNAEEIGEELPRSETFTDAESFYDLYKTEGLVAFFDALDPENGTLDLANGKWYAKVYDEATGTFVKSETIYATITGGVYDAEGNPTGWKIGESGFGYDDPDFTADNAITFDHQALLCTGVGLLNAPFDNWTVETTLKVNLRSIPATKQAYTASSEGEYALTVVTEGEDLGAYAAKTTLLAPGWGTQKNAVVTLTGVAGESANVNTIVSGEGATSVTKAFSVTFDANGKATISVPFCNGENRALRNIAIYTPEGVAVDNVVCPVHTAQNVAASYSAFLFGPVAAHLWTNTLGEDFSGGGDGTCRWSITKKPGSYNQPRIMVLAPGVSNEWQNSTVFKSENGAITSLVASKITNGNNITYNITHGGNLHTATYDKTQSGYDFADLGLKIMDKAQGMVYAVRIYGSKLGEAATNDESKYNASVDTMIRLGVDIEKFNELNDELKDVFLTVNVPLLSDTATKEEVEKAIDDIIAFEAQKENAKKFTDYDNLYVGADGSTTANGGKLVSLFSAFGGDVSVDMTSGTWINKIGDVNATFGNLKYWERREDGSVGYTGFYGQLNPDGSINTSASTNNISAGASSFTNTRLNLGLDLLPKDDYTIEYVAKYMPIYVANEDGTIAKDAQGNPLEYFVASGQGVSSSQYAGAIDYIGFISSWSVKRDGTYASQMPNRGDVIWMLKNGKASWGNETNWVGCKPFTNGGGLLAAGARENGAIHTYVMTRDETVTVGAENERVVEAIYGTHRDGVTYSSQALSTANTAQGMEYFDADDPIDFYLSSMLPTDFYCVRIYDAALTTDEMKWNTFIDMAAAVGASLNDFLAIDEEETQKMVIDLMVSGGFPADAVAFTASLQAALDIYANPVTADDSLYIKDGLRVLTAAYSSFHTGSISTESSISWFNAAVVGEYITVKGKGWELRPDGGYYMIKDYGEFSKDRAFGLYLTPDMLPEDDYTVQMVINPTGIVEYDDAETKTYSRRYVDVSTTYGLHYEHGFSIGPLRCLIFPSKAEGGDRAGLEKRWCYDSGDRCWNISGRNHIFTENAWNFTDINEILSYAITFDRDTSAKEVTYKVYSNNTIVNTKVHADRYTNEQANNMFQLMCSMPGGVFSVRVYDRALTQEELIQNHAVDIIYYYNLDTTLLDKVLVFFKDDQTKVFRGLTELGFDMSKDEAQRMFDARLSALWLMHTDMAVRNDESDGMRYYFDFDASTATIMINNGYKVEIGAVVNIGQNAQPTIDGYNYDYRIVAYDSIAGKTSGFFVDEDTFAVTVKASGGSEALLSNVYVRGYIRLIAPNGEEMVFYAEVEGADYDPNSLFEVYDHMSKTLGEGYEDFVEVLEDKVDACFVRDYVYLQAGAPAGGNGTKDAPFNNYADAFVAAKQKLLTLNKPTYVVLEAGDGIYEINQILSVDGSEIPYRYSRFVLTSANGKSTLTSNKVLNNADFHEAEGNIWTYQFDKDASGNYPEFRYFYVNGEIASIAHNGAANINENDVLRYNSAFYRYEDGPMIVAGELYKNGALHVDDLYYPEEKVALRSRFAYFRDWYLAYDEVMALYGAGTLAHDTATAVADPTTVYSSFFEDFKYNRVAVAEITKFYKTEADSNLGKFLDLAKNFTGADENAPQAYKDVLATLLSKVTAKMQGGAIFKSAIQEANLPLPKAFTTTEAQDQKLTAVSSGVYDTVKALHAAGKLTHESVPATSELPLAQGQQFLYYRDAFLALDAVKALSAEELTFETMPDENGSEQYKELFYVYLYQQIAAKELAVEQARLQALNFEGVDHGAFTFKSAIGNYKTIYEDAPDEYLVIFTTMRDEGMLNFTYFNKLVVEVLEKDGPYEGDLPMYDPRDENKVYFQRDLVGDQSFAVAQGYTILADEAVTLVAEAYAAYRELYTLFMDAQKHHENLVYLQKLSAKYKTQISEDQKAAIAAEMLAVMQSDALIPESYYEKIDATFFEGLAANYAGAVNRTANECKAGYEAYLKALATAEQYLSDENDERYTLKESGLEFKMVVEWNFNIVHVSGVDYDDKIVKNGVEYVALYLKESEYKGFVTHSESYFMNRMTTMQFSKSYLDKNNEFYYDAVTGTIYYYNENGIDGLTFEYPTMENMFYFSNIERMTIDNLAFTGLDDTIVTKDGFTGGQASGDSHTNFLGVKDNFPSRAPIYIDYCYDMVIENCHFHDLGCEGITTRMKAKNLIIDSNTFERIGSSAIRIGGSSSSSVAFNAADGAEYTEITNNYLSGIALYIFTSPAIYMQYAKDIKINYNTIIGCSYTGISIGWNWSAAGFMYGENVKLMHCEVAYNYVTDFMMELGDGGALYTLGGNAAPEEKRLFNWAHDNFWLCSNISGDGEQHFFAANYHDGSSSHWETYNTVVAAHSFGAAYVGDVYNSPKDETMRKAIFAMIDTDLEMDEYVRRLRNRRNSIYYYYEQTVAGADSWDITLHDNFLINTRCTKNTDNKYGSQHYEAFRGRAREEFYIYTINTRFVRDPGNIPGTAEDIIYEAGCDLYDGIYKGDASLLYDNNY